LTPDTLNLAKELIGKVFITNFKWNTTSRLIVKTEAYIGTTDKACHSFGGKMTPRNSTIFKKGGIAYVYICYGIHHLVNIVNHKKGKTHAVLIRETQPL
jgi:DNA-3-methyladenine glycosylase